MERRRSYISPKKLCCPFYVSLDHRSRDLQRRLIIRVAILDRHREDVIAKWVNFLVPSDTHTIEGVKGTNKEGNKNVTE